MTYRYAYVCVCVLLLCGSAECRLAGGLHRMSGWRYIASRMHQRAVVSDDTINKSPPELRI